MTLFKINLLLWRHFDISSVLLLSRTFVSARGTTIFRSDTNRTSLCKICIEMHTILYSVVDGKQILIDVNCHRWPTHIFWIVTCNENEFNKVKPLYDSALKISGFNYGMKFKATVENTSQNKNRKIIWFNSLYSLNIKSNIGKVFLKLVRKHFPRSLKFNKIFNLNTHKISYGSTPNAKNLNKQPNSKILSKEQDKIQPSCNCRIKESCPLNGKRLQH